MRPSPPILQCLRPECLLSRFLPCKMHNREIFLTRLLLQTDAVATGLFAENRVILGHYSKRYYWSAQWHSEPPFIWCLPNRREILNVSQMAVAFHRIRPPFVTQTRLQIVPQMSILSLCALLFQRSYLFPICVVSTYNDSRKESSQSLPNSKELSV